MNDEEQARWNNVKDIATEQLGFEPTDAFVQMVFDKYTKPDMRYNYTSFNTWMQYADPMVLIDMGRADERRKTADPVTWAFRRYLYRDPDSSGFHYYTTQIAEGRPEWQVIREIALSPEAQAKERG